MSKEDSQTEKKQPAKKNFLSALQATKQQL